MTDSYNDATLASGLQGTENKLVNRALTKLPIPYITGLKLEADVHLNGLTLNTFETPTNENGYQDSVLWVCTEIDGWWTIPDPEIPDLTRGWGDGSYDAKGRYNSRLITVQGSILVQDPRDAPKARDTLVRALALVHTGGWLKVDEGPTKSAYVRLSGAPKIDSINPRGRINFSVGLKAADPIKYEWTTGSTDGYEYIDLPSSSTSQVTITNSGNIAVPVVFELRGGLANVTETDVALIRNVTSDQTITIVGPVTSSQTLEIDTYNREVLVVSNSGADVVSGRPKTETLLDWIYLQPGDNRLSFYDSSTSPSSAICRVYWRSGWIG